MRRIFTTILLLVFIGSMTSCRKNRLDPYSGGEGPQYFPVKLGSSWIYQVDSIHYDKKFSNRNDTFAYQVRHVIESEFVDNEGKINQSFTRYISSDTQNWKVNGSFSVSISPENVVRNFENKKEIILKFPIQEFDFWDGNSLNLMPLQEFEYSSVYTSMGVNGQVFDSTCTVLHENVLNRVQTFFEENSYAKHVGLIYRKWIRIDEKDIDTEEPMKGSMAVYQLIRFEE